MKFTAAGSPNNNMNQINNREYVSISPKFASATYSEGFGKQYNSPKTAVGPAKGFIIPKTNNENLVSTFTKQQKNNSFLGQSKDKLTRGPILLVGSEVQTPKTLGNSTLNNRTLGIKDDKKATPQKAKNELRTVSSSTPKNSNSYRPSDLSKGREESSYSGNYRWKKLEITTDYNNVRTSYANKAQTTKHTETEEDLTRETTTKSSGISQSVNKSTQNKGSNSATYNLYSNSTDKPRSTRPLSSSDANLRSNSAQKDGKNAYQNRNASSTRDAPKVNNFVHSESKPTIKKEKTTSSATKLGQTLSTGFDDNMSQSNGFLKKSTNKTQVDLRSSWHSTANDSLKSKNRPSSAKKPARDSREETLDKISPKDEKTPTQRVSLQMFVTKVNKGDAFSSIKKYGDRSNSTRKNQQQKPYLTIEDKASKPVKAVDLELKGSKTTPNLESKAFAVSLGKHGSQTPVSKGKSGAGSKYGSSSSIKEQNKSTQEAARTQGREPFIYYMSGLEKAHRWDGEVDYFVQIYREHFIQTYQALSFCKVLKPFDPAVLAQKRVNLPRRDTHLGKKTLIFDMDETLIHCNESPDLPCDVILPITFPNGEIVEAGVNVRPYALEILKELSQHYEIVVFTASHACYANVVLDYLDPQEQYIHHRLFRDSCVVTDEGVHIKDLRVIGNRDMKDMILVDNAAYSFGFQIENGIPIIPFYDNKSDQELRHLIPYLKFLNSVEDLREINKQTFRLHLFANYDTPEAVLERLILQ